MNPNLSLLRNLLILLLLGALPALAQEEKPDAPATGEEAEESIESIIEGLFEQLNSEEFRVRESATFQLWRLGDKAEPFVREAAQSGDLELRTRAARLLGLFKYGVYPDTPPEMVKLINRFRHGNLNAKTSALRQLYDGGQLVTVAKLIRTIENASTRRQLVNSVIEELDGKLGEMFALEKYDAVQSLLELAAISDEGLRNLSAFHLARGTIDQELEKLLEREKAGEFSSLEYEQLSWHFRLQGDLESALAAATAAENKLLENSIRIAQGDLLTLVKSSYNPNDRTIQAFGYTAAAQRLSGDDESFEKTIETIKKYASDHPDEIDQCLEALIINGRDDDALEIAVKGSGERLQFLIDRGEHLAALAELGIDDPKPPYEDWLKRIEKEFAGARTSQDYNRIIGPPYTLARLLGSWGEEAEATRIFDRLGKVAHEEAPQFLSRVITNASVLGMKDVAMKYTHLAFTKEALDAAAGVDGPGVDPAEARIRNRVGQRGEEESLIRSLYFNEAHAAGYWWDQLEYKFGAEGSISRLGRLETLMGEDKAAALELAKKFVPTEEEALDEEEHVGRLTNLAELHLRHDDRDTAMKLFKESLTLPRQDAFYANHGYATMLVADGKWEEALPYFKAATVGDSPSTYHVVQYGVALEHCGKNEEAEKVLHRARLQALGRPMEFRRIAAGFAMLEEFDRAREASQLAVNLALVDDSTVHGEVLQLSDFLVHDAPLRAAMYKERYLIECLKGHIPLNRLSSGQSIRGSIASLKARAALAEGRTDEAVDRMRTMVGQQPSNSSLLEDLYPLLVKAGRQKEADEFYEKLNAYGEKTLALFPNSPQDLNSNAWLKARCGKDLDTALERSKRSNELYEKNYAYLDTLAEVYFQRGDREQAVKESTKAVELAGSDFLLYRQLQHFKNDEPLSKTLK